MTTSFLAKYGLWALITGASRGLGAEFARQCAERGLNVILVATNADLLKKQADLIKNDYGVEVRTIVFDLSREDVLQAITPVTDPLEVGLLINNGGSGRTASSTAGRGPAASPRSRSSAGRTCEAAARQRQSRVDSGSSLRQKNGR